MDQHVSRDPSEGEQCEMDQHQYRKQSKGEQFEMDQHEYREQWEMDHLRGSTSCMMENSKDKVRLHKSKFKIGLGSLPFLHPHQIVSYCPLP